MGIQYESNYVQKPDQAFEYLSNNLPWKRRDTTPRMEVFFSTIGHTYTYGSNGYERTYTPEPDFDLVVRELIQPYSEASGIEFELCFLNRYLNQSDHLGWHADDSPEIDQTRPIAVISLGVEREIWFKRQYCHVCHAREKQPTEISPLCSVHQGPFVPPIEKLKLEHGSLLIMPPGYQDTHYHRIPKAGFACGERISLTYRGAA